MEYKVYKFLSLLKNKRLYHLIKDDYAKQSKHYSGIYNCFLLIVTEDKKKIANAIFFEDPCLPYIWRLGHMQINKDFRGKGVGIKIIKEISKYVKSKKGKKIIVYASKQNIKARKFYSKNKFINEGILKKHKLGKDNMYLMSKFLK